MCFVAAFGYSQDVLENFEGTAPTINFFDGANTANIVADPAPGGTNGDVLELITNTAGQPWQGTQMLFQDNYIDLTGTDKTVTIDVYSTTPVSLLAKVDGPQNAGAASGTDANHTGSGWETLTFDFAVPKDNLAVASDEYSNIVFFPGWENLGGTCSVGCYSTGSENNTPAITVYLDNITGVAGSAVNPPSNVTFSVDMSDYTGTINTGLFIGGDFNGWSDTANPMTDMGNGIWEATIPIPDGDILFKYIVDAWGGDESLTQGSSCTATGGGFTNRSYTVAGDAAIGTVCWESCLACGAVAPDRNITFSVDMSAYVGTVSTVHVSGSFNGWSGDANPMTDDGNGVWSVTLPLTDGSYEYKYTFNNFGVQENFVGGESCTVTNGGYTNRALTVTADETLDTVCWESCEACPPSIPAPPAVPTYSQASDYSSVFSSYGEAVGLVPSAFAGASEQTVSLGGDDVKEISIVTGGGGMNLAFAPIDIDAGGFTHLYFNYYFDGTEEIGKVFNYQLQGGGANLLGQIFLDPVDRSSDGWQTIDIAIADLQDLAGTSPTNAISLVQMSGAGGAANPWGKVYIDNVLFYNNAPLSNNQFEAAEFRAFPNPTSNNWTISGNNVIKTVAVYDILGKQVVSLTPNSIEAVIDASSLRTGVYFAKIEGVNGSKTVKLVRE